MTAAWAARRAWGNPACKPRRGPPHSKTMTDTQPVPPMKAAIIPVTPLQQNCSLIWCTSTMRGALVAPGGDLDQLKAAVAQAGVTLEKILLTQGHICPFGTPGMLAQGLGLPDEGPTEQHQSS